MKKILTLTLACTMVMGLFLSGCAMKDEPSSSGTGTSNSGSSGQREVVVCGWGENIDEDLFDLFEEKTGSSPLRYLNYLRIQEACHYLDFTDMKISQISPLVGYEDSLYFSRLFTKTMGIPPSEYKAKKKG